MKIVFHHNDGTDGNVCFDCMVDQMDCVLSAFYFNTDVGPLRMRAKRQSSRFLYSFRPLLKALWRSSERQSLTRSAGISLTHYSWILFLRYCPPRPLLINFADVHKLILVHCWKLLSSFSPEISSIRCYTQFCDKGRFPHGQLSFMDKA